MKKLVVCMAAMAILAGSIGVSAQTKTNMLSTNPLGIVFGVFNLEYQKALGEKTSIGISAMYWKPPLIKLNVLGATLSFTIFSKSAFHGFFVKPLVDIGYASWKISTLDLIAGTTTETKSSGISFGLGAVAGYRWLWNSGFSLGLGGGVAYTLGDYGGLDFGGISPKALFDLGWAF